MMPLLPSLSFLPLLLGGLLLSAVATATPAPGLLPILDPVLAIGAASPPTFARTHSPSPQCAAVNGGELQCCRGTVAGDLQLVVFLAKLYGFKLNPDDINGLDCDRNLDACPGVKVCCQVTALSPLLSLYCQDYDP